MTKAGIEGPPHPPGALEVNITFIDGHPDARLECPGPRDTMGTLTQGASQTGPMIRRQGLLRPLRGRSLSKGAAGT
jgi:hypothetical protein